MRTCAVIPTLNESAAIGPFVSALLADVCADVVVVDGGSRDDTIARARSAGARVTIEPRRGYGRAVTAGIVVAKSLGAQALVVVDGNGSIAPDDVARVLAPVCAARAELALGVRPDSDRLYWHQRLGNRLAVAAIARVSGFRYADVGAVRAIAADALDRLALDELGHGWPLQLCARAATMGFCIEQIPIGILARQSPSKISGTVRGSLGAALGFSRVLWRDCRARSR